MSNISRSLSVFAIILALHPSAFAQPAVPPTAPPAWPVTSAPARFIIEPIHGAPPMPVSWVNLFLPEPKWETLPLRVFTDTGIPVGSDLLWTAPGEPATLLFDSSANAKHYQVYVGSNLPPLHLADMKAGVWLESRVGDGKTIDHPQDMLEAWKQSGQVLGRAIVGGFFEGGNRFGPQGNILLHLQGWFEAANPEHLELATVSVDASFVFVDGKEVVEWPGRHDWRYPSSGPPQGAVDLSAGLHVIDYYNAYIQSPEGNPPLLCSLSVKGGPFTQWTTILPNGGFIRPFNVYRAVSYELQTNSPGGVSLPGTAPALAINWAIKGQSVINTDVADIGLVSMQLTCLANPAGTLTWTFDDGSTVQGQSVQHLFARPGMRTVRLSLKDGDKEAATLSQTLNVHLDWGQTHDQPRLYPEHEADIMGRDPATLSTPDLTSCYAVFGAFQRTDDLLKFLPVICAKMKEINEADLPYVKDAALFLVREDWVHFAEEIQLLRALIDRSAVDQPSPQLIKVGSECRLALAELTLKTSDHLDEVRPLLDAINVPALSGNEPRVLNMLRADLALASGDVEGARKQYETLTGEPSGPDARSSIRRTARIGQARAFLDRKDFAAAEDALNEVAWQAPIEKMAPDWALTRLRLYQEQNLPVPAYLWAKRLLPVITGGGRSELLFRLTDLAFAQGDTDLAHKTLSELLKNHPYSEEAAQAKAKWPSAE